jgi:hypothetical protein
VKCGLKQLAAVPGVTISSESQGLVDFSRDNISFSNFTQESTVLNNLQDVT